MINFRKFALGVLSLFLLVATGLGCGAGQGITIAIQPAGPTNLMKGQTLQFTAITPVAVTWSVVGGSDNGTIDNNGLYTPPTTLPINPQITVRVTSDLGQVANSIVNLKTGDAVTFGASEQINDTAVAGLNLLAELLGCGVTDRLSVNLNGNQLDVDSVWTGNAGASMAVMFDQNVDLLGFGTDDDLSGDPTQSYVAGTIITNSSLNPGVVMISDSSGTGRLQYLASSDQGDNFDAPVDIDPSDPTDRQIQPNAKLDDQGVIHLVFNHESSASGTGNKIRYVQSSDDGAHWSTAIPVSSAATEQLYPNIAVSADGQQIHVCFSDDRGSGGATDDIVVFTSTNGGASFDTSVYLTSSGSAQFCRIALGDQGQLFVTYSDNGDIMFARSENSGTSFLTPQKVNSSSTNTPTPFSFMAVDSLGRIDMIWHADEDNDGIIDDLMYSRSLNDGDSWAINTIIDDGTGESTLLGMGLVHDISGRVHIQYLSNVNGVPATHDIFYQMAE